MMHLHDMLRNDDMQEYHKAIADLSLIPRSQAVRLLEELLIESNGEYRARAIDGMAKVFPDLGEMLAIQFLNDQEWFMRVTCIDVLSRLGSRTAIPKVVILLSSDSDEIVRSWAAFFLGVVGDESVIPDLQRCMEIDQGTDHEGTPISEIAGKAIEKIRSRIPRTQ